MKTTYLPRLMLPSYLQHCIVPLLVERGTEPVLSGPFILILVGSRTFSHNNNHKTIFMTCSENIIFLYSQIYSIIQGTLIFENPKNQ